MRVSVDGSTTVTTGKVKTGEFSARLLVLGSNLGGVRNPKTDHYVRNESDIFMFCGSESIYRACAYTERSPTVLLSGSVV